MNMPGFTAETSLNKGRFTYHASISQSKKIARDIVVPQACWCECYLQRTCIRLPPNFIPHCFTTGTYCVPVGRCPPGYCGGFHPGL
jgi:hypothetical protein